MKKKIMAALLAGVMVLAVGCGGKGENGNLTLGEYKGLTLTSVSQATVDAELSSILESYTEYAEVDRTAQEGDTVNINFVGTLNGVAFEGGKAENHGLVLGSHSFIDTFEDQIIGHVAGDEFDVNVTFPEQYHSDDLAGKPAVFKVKVNEIKAKELPELNDEFAQDVSEFDTLAEYKEDIKARLVKEKEAEAKRTKEDEAIAKIIEKSTLSPGECADVPGKLIVGCGNNSALEILELIPAGGKRMTAAAFRNGMRGGLPEFILPEPI